MIEYIKHLFDPQPGTEFMFFLPTLLIFSIALAGGLFYRRFLKKNPDKTMRLIMKKVPGQLITIGLVGLLYIFARNQNLPYLSMSAIGIILLGILLFIIIKAIRLIKKVYPQMQTHHLRNNQSKKYLPKKKNQHR